MPNPKNFKNTEEGYKNYMNTCMHQVMHMERKKKDQAVGQCMNMWRKEYGDKHPGKIKKESNMNMTVITAGLDAIADRIQTQDPVIAMALDKISDTIEHVEASVTVDTLIRKTTPDRSFTLKDLKNITPEEIQEAQAIIQGKPGMTAEAGKNSKAILLAIALLAAGFSQANATNVNKVVNMPTMEIQGKLPVQVQLALQKNFPGAYDFVKKG